MSGTATKTSFSRGENPLRADKVNLALSERVARSGDTMQGPLTLAADPVSPGHAATKQYVDTMVGLIGGGGDGAISIELPTSSFGLPPGTWWNNGGFVCVA